MAHFGFIDTQMVRDSFSDPVAQKLEALTPAFVNRRLSPAQAAAGIVSAIENRRPRVILPGWWKGWFALRGILNPLFDAAMLRNERYLELLREADQDERAARRGGLAEPTHAR